MKITITHTAEVPALPESCATCPFNARDLCEVAPHTKDGMSLTPAARKKRARGCTIEVA